MSIDLDVKKVLIALANNKQVEHDSQQGRYVVEGKEILSMTNLSPEKINDAVEILHENGYVDVTKTFRTAPYDFRCVELKARGRLEAERLKEAENDKKNNANKEKSSLFVPVGSPYGFSDYDWQCVKLDWKNKRTLIVVLGFQWSSNYYNSDKLVKNLKTQFNETLKEINNDDGLSLQLDFKKLKGGYGNHLFNEIARTIIGSDIVILEISDQNANVMIEMGVALTWNRNILPIKEVKSVTTPSDISGQTWAEYTNNAEKWNNPDHNKQVKELIKKAMINKNHGKLL